MIAIRKASGLVVAPHEDSRRWRGVPLRLSAVSQFGHTQSGQDGRAIIPLVSILVYGSSHLFLDPYNTVLTVTTVE